MSNLREAVLGPAPDKAAPPPVLEVRDLSVVFATRAGPITAVDQISYRIERGRTLGVVGESGCGKSVAAMAVMRLVDPPGRITGGAVMLRGTDLRRLTEERLRTLRGREFAMIFQEPMTALNPVMTVGDQVAEVLILHDNLAARDAWRGAVDLLDRVGIALPMKRAHDYPHQLSGGMRQRVMIAMALACRPSLLIADEPTTALDVTVQAQILDLMVDLQDSHGMAIQFISHDLGVVSEIADDVVVMYAGRIVEAAPAEQLFEDPRHPYTQGLLATLPRIGAGRRRLEAIPGAVPDLADLPTGCAFRDRCPRAIATCAGSPPSLLEVEPGHRAACYAVTAP
jgi:oligopeptide/dipeptide ABC transporter ATP-binding protein